MKTLIFLAALLSLGSLAGCTSAGGPIVSVPDDKTLKAISYDPDGGGLLKVTPAGVSRSRGGGANWQPLPLRCPLPSSGLSQIAVIWKNPKMLITSGPDAGVLKSDDAGLRWTGINGGMPSKQLSAVATHTDLPNTFFAAVQGNSGGIYKTEDGGGAWKRMDGGPPVSRVDGLVHSTLPGSMNTGWLYAATPEGLYLSMDCF